MSDRYVRGINGKRTWYRVALGTMRAEGGPSGARWMIDFETAKLRRMLEEDGYAGDELEEELENTYVFQLADLADAFGMAPQTLSKELRAHGFELGSAQCVAHQSKRCDCKTSALLTLGMVEFLWPYCVKAYHRQARRPGRVNVTGSERRMT